MESVNQRNFINRIGQLAMLENKKREKKVLPSICIAQACLETGYGQSQLMKKANAYFGIKANSAWKGKVFNANTKECYDGVNLVSVKDALFRAYDNDSESVKDYYDLITKSNRYAKAVNEMDSFKCITSIKNGGYATDPSYINKIMIIVNKHNLNDFNDYDKNDLSLQVGDRVKILNTWKEMNKTYGTSYTGNRFRLYYDTYEVLSITGERVIIGINNITTCAINIKNLKKVG